MIFLWGKKDLDAILLVGGTTRTQMVAHFLEERAGTIPHQDLDPDLCVALGAGVLASRLPKDSTTLHAPNVFPFCPPGWP